MKNTLKNSPLFEGLGKEECETACNEIKPVVEKYDESEVITQEGTEESDLGIILKGVVRGEKFHMEGDVHIVNLYEKGDFISLDTVTTKSRIAPITLVANCNVEIFAININKLLVCTYREKIMLNIIQILADENIKKLFKSDILSHAGLRDRIMTYLRIMDQKHKGAFHTMMTQEQFAQFLSVNRSALSHELNKMRKDGLINFKKDKFEVLK